VRRRSIAVGSADATVSQTTTTTTLVDEDPMVKDEERAAMRSMAKQLGISEEKALQMLRSMEGDDAVMGTALPDRYLVPMRTPTKFKMAYRWIKAADPDDKILIFSDLVRHFRKLKAYLEGKGIACEIFWGAMSRNDRDAVLKRFHEPTSSGGARVLLISLKCGSQGLNLQVANHVLIAADWWNGAFEEQCTRRCVRPGQLKTVYVVFLVLRDTIDEMVLSRAGEKSDLVSRVIGKDDGVLKTGSNFTRPDLEEAIYMDVTSDMVPKRMDDGSMVIVDDYEPPSDETLDDIRNLPVRPIQHSEKQSQLLSQLYTKHGKINRSLVARLVVEQAGVHLSQQQMLPFYAEDSIS
jgi:superfamily II DNA or RNA helicase